MRVPVNPIGRRNFLRLALTSLGALLIQPLLQACGLAWETAPVATPRLTPSPDTIRGEEDGLSRVAFVRGRSRSQGVPLALGLLELNPVQGKTVLLKPNFNSTDPAPASTHPDTLRALVEWLWAMGAVKITVADRSGMGTSDQVMQTLGIYEMADELGFETLSLEDLQSEEDWELIQSPDSHWSRGFPIARICRSMEAVVQTCCLKPHRFGGHFTMSLKNSIGLVAHHLGGRYYMQELHSSPDQRLMIAEVNTAYSPALIVLDGVEAFIDAGPDTGTKVWGEVILAGTDRVAVDAVGLALLRYLGYTGEAAKGSIFQQDQIRRAVELGLGVDQPQKIRLVTPDEKSAAYAAEIQEVLLLEG